MAQSTVNITIPATIAGAQLDIAQNATANFAIAIRTSDAAYSAPGEKDWATELSLYWGGTALERQIAGAVRFKTDGWYAIGITRISGEVQDVSDSVVNILACVDDSSVDIRDSDGNSRIDRAELPRQVLYRISKFPDLGWLIDNLEVPQPVQTC